MHSATMGARSCRPRIRNNVAEWSLVSGRASFPRYGWGNTPSQVTRPSSVPPEMAIANSPVGGFTGGGCALQKFRARDDRKYASGCCPQDVLVILALRAGGAPSSAPPPTLFRLPSPSIPAVAAFSSERVSQE